jgi:hypothetical protein
LDEGADLVAGDGFLLQQGGGELGEGFPVAGEQFPGAGFRPGQQAGDFLVDQPLGVLGVAAWCRERRVAGGRATVADRSDLVAEAVLADHLRRPAISSSGSSWISAEASEEGMAAVAVTWTW